MNRALLMLVLLATAGCEDYPKDAGKTLRAIQSSQTLRVGLIEQKPWAYESDNQPQGVEVEVVSDFAQQLGVQVQWQFLSEAQAIEKLEQRELDLVAGGLTKDSPRKKQVGFTRAYLKLGENKKNHHVMAATQGENRFIVTLEKFLKSNEAKIQQRVEEVQSK